MTFTENSHSKDTVDFEFNYDHFVQIVNCCFCEAKHGCAKVVKMFLK